MCSDARAEGNIVPEVVILENREMLAALTAVTSSKPLAQKFLSNLIQQVRLAHVAVLSGFTQNPNQIQGHRNSDNKSGPHGAYETVATLL